MYIHMKYSVFSRCSFHCNAEFLEHRFLWSLWYFVVFCQDYFLSLWNWIDAFWVFGTFLPILYTLSTSLLLWRLRLLVLPPFFTFSHLFVWFRFHCSFLLQVWMVSLKCLLDNVKMRLHFIFVVNATLAIFVFNTHTSFMLPHALVLLLFCAPLCFHSLHLSWGGGVNQIYYAILYERTDSTRIWWQLFFFLIGALCYCVKINSRLKILNVKRSRWCQLLRYTVHYCISDKKMYMNQIHSNINLTINNCR